METVELRQLDVDVVHTFTYSGNLSPESLKMRLYNDSGGDRHIKYVRGSVGSPPEGESIVVDILCNGKTIFSNRNDPDDNRQTYKPKIEIKENTSSNVAEPRVSLWGDGKYLTVDIEQIGTTFPGSDLTINVVVTR